MVKPGSIHAEWGVAFGIPIIAIEPALQPAIVAGWGAVMATTRALRSLSFRRLRNRFAGRGAESADFASLRVKAPLARLLSSALEKGPTFWFRVVRYPLLSDAIQGVAGSDVQVIGPSSAGAEAPGGRYWTLILSSLPEIHP